jgi:hypothetical protein
LDPGHMHLCGSQSKYVPVEVSLKRLGPSACSVN